MRYVVFALSFLPAALLGFAAGFYYRAEQFPPSAQMEDYALSNLLENLGYAAYLRQGNHASLRELLNVAIEGHLTRVQRSQGANEDPEFNAAKVRTLHSVAKLWAHEPPFTSAEWKENETNKVWWDDWKAQQERNRALLRWAEDECVRNPALNCRTPSLGGTR